MSACESGEVALATETREKRFFDFKVNSHAKRGVSMINRKAFKLMQTLGKRSAIKQLNWNNCYRGHDTCVKSQSLYLMLIN